MPSDHSTTINADARGLAISAASFDPREHGLGSATRIDASSLAKLIAWARAHALGGMQLDATAPGLRPRELDRSARRDLAVSLRRAELSLAGIDLFVPPEHFVSAEHQDRAIAAVRSALELAVELTAHVAGAAVVTLQLPAEPSADDVVRTLGEYANRSGARLADAAWPRPDPDTHDVAIDPASILLAGDDPAVVVPSLGERAAAARLSDLDSVGRTMPGSSGARLNVAAYRATLAIAGVDGLVVVDCRGVRRQAHAIAGAVDAWRAATPGV